MVSPKLEPMYRMAHSRLSTSVSASVPLAFGLHLLATSYYGQARLGWLQKTLGIRSMSFVVVSLLALKENSGDSDVVCLYATCNATVGIVGGQRYERCNKTVLLIYLLPPLL
jgi:hypothetical protein